MKKEIERLLIDDFPLTDKKLTDVILELQNILNEYPKAYFKKHLYGYDGGYDLEIRYLREETDEEFQKRIDIELKLREEKRRKLEAKLAKEQLTKKQKILALEKELSQLREEATDPNQ